MNDLTIKTNEEFASLVRPLFYKALKQEGKEFMISKKDGDHKLSTIIGNNTHRSWASVIKTWFFGWGYEVGQPNNLYIEWVDGARGVINVRVLSIFWLNRLNDCYSFELLDFQIKPW